MKRYLALNGFALAMLLYAGVHGLIREAYLADSTGFMVLLIFYVILFGVLAEGMERCDLAQWIAKHLPLLGLVGTLIGFIVALSGIVTFSSAADARSGVASILPGIGTALWTTLLSVVGTLYLRGLHRFGHKGARGAVDG